MNNDTYKINSPSAITLKLKQGVDKNSLRFLTEQCWNVPEDHKDLFQELYLLYWNPKFLQQHIQDGILQHPLILGTKYRVKFHNCAPESVFKSQKQVALSFRLPSHETGILPVVLVSCSRT